MTKNLNLSEKRSIVTSTFTNVGSENTLNLSNEIWKDVPNYEGYYQVSNLGRVKRLDTWVKRSDGLTRHVKEWKRISKAVFKRDNYTCQYCGKVGGKLEVDHIFPFSKGGSDSLENLTTSCQKCNRQKRDKSVDDFLKWRDNHGKT